MTEQDFLDKAKNEIKFLDEGDNALYHAGMDNLLVQALRELGWDRLADCYEEASRRFWYE